MRVCARPDLEQTVRNNDLDIQISPNGAILSRSPVPIWLRRQVMFSLSLSLSLSLSPSLDLLSGMPLQWMEWPDYTQHNLDQTICSDGEIGTVLKTYREVCSLFLSPSLPLSLSLSLFISLYLSLSF